MRHVAHAGIRGATFGGLMGTALIGIMRGLPFDAMIVAAVMGYWREKILRQVEAICECRKEEA